MYDESRFESVIKILRLYGVKPYFIENKGKVNKIYSNKGTLALKEIKPNFGIDFVHKVQTLYQAGYNRIVPIYPTKDGRYGVLYENKLYYLMPWVSNVVREKRAKNEQLFRELARIHLLTQKKITINNEELTEHYNKTLEFYEKNEQFLNEYIDHCESKLYMSPFELAFCLRYKEIKQALQFAKAKFTEWHEQVKESDKVRTVVVHGKLTEDHFLLDERGYGFFINFENTRRLSPIHDLLPFMANNCKGHLKRNDKLVDLFYVYLKYFPLGEDELLLFLSYLSYPGKIVGTIENYYFNKKSKNEAKAVRQLQRNYLYLKNVEYVIMKIVTIEEQKKQAEEEAKTQQQNG